MKEFIYIEIFHDSFDIHRLLPSKDFDYLGNLSDSHLVDFKGTLKRILKEPIKFLKDPNYYSIAIKTIKDPIDAIFLDIEYMHQRIYNKDGELIDSSDLFYKISKESIEELSKEDFIRKRDLFIECGENL